MRRLLLTTALLAPTLAHAEIPETLHLDLTAGTVLPLEVGGRMQLEMPGRVRVGVHAGWLPPDYVDLVHAISLAAGWYDELTAALISAALDDAALVGGDVSWRPLPKHGFFFGAGYQAALLGGGLTSAEVVEAVGGASAGRARGDDTPELLASATVHQVTVQVGWEEAFLDRVVLRVALGGAFTVASSSTITPDGRDPRQGAEAVYAAGADALDQTMTSYVHTPTIDVSLGYRFF